MKNKKALPDIGSPRSPMDFGQGVSRIGEMGAGVIATLEPCSDSGLSLLMSPTMI
jgi:hypothetical protein